MRYFSFLLFSVFLFACNPSVSSDDLDVVDVTDQAAANPNALVIKEKCAVILSYSTEEIEAMQKEYSEEDFAEVASDIGYYNAMAHEGLTPKGIKVVSTDKEEVIFVQSNGEQTIIKRKDYDKDLIFFSPEQKPLGTFTADFTEDLSYFGIKNGNEFVEGYWIEMRTLDSAKEDHVFSSFYKTSLVNDQPLLQFFDNGNISIEEILLEQKDGSFKQGEEETFYKFRDGKDITVTELGMIRGLIRVSGNRIKE